MCTLWLFDIDGTLVNINQIHLQAYQQAYQKVTGQVISKRIIVSKFGMAGREEQESVLREAGIRPTAGMVTDIVRQYNRYLPPLLKKTAIRPLPGVRQLLDALRMNKINIISIISGNPKTTGDHILRKAGLLHYFPYRFYDNGRDKRREDILKRAVRTVKKVQRIIVIGDTVTDIQAGKAVGAVTIGVASGSCTVTTLRKEKADVVVRSLREFRKIL